MDTDVFIEMPGNSLKLMVVLLNKRNFITKKTFATYGDMLAWTNLSKNGISSAKKYLTDERLLKKAGDERSWWIVDPEDRFINSPQLGTETVLKKGLEQSSIEELPIDNKQLIKDNNNMPNVEVNVTVNVPDPVVVFLEENKTIKTHLDTLKIDPAKTTNKFQRGLVEMSPDDVVAHLEEAIEKGNSGFAINALEDRWGVNPKKKEKRLEALKEAKKKSFAKDMEIHRFQKTEFVGRNGGAYKATSLCDAPLVVEDVMTLIRTNIQTQEEFKKMFIHE